MLSRVALVRTDVSREHIKATSKQNTLHSVLRLLVTANVVPSLPIIDTLMMEEILSSETSVLTRTTWHNIPEDGILHSHHHENLRSYIGKHLSDNFPIQNSLKQGDALLPLLCFGLCH
jgi:hypothetical protein